MHYFLAFTCLLFMSFSPIFAVEEIPSNSAEAFKPLGKIHFDAKKHAFGSVKRGEKLRHRFTFTNVGKGTLVIQGVHAACGCTVASTDQTHGSAYKSGETGFVDVVFDTTNFVGKIEKSVTVVTNEAVKAASTLKLSADIRAEIAAKPPLLDFGTVSAREGAAKSFVVEADAGIVLDVNKLRYTQDVLAVSAEVLAANKWKVNVALKPNVATGFLKDVIYIANSSAALPELSVPVRANIVGNIRLSQNYIEFGAVAPKDAVTRTVDLSVVGGYEIVGSKAEININGARVSDVNPFVDVKIDLKTPENRKVAVKLKNAAESTGSVHGKLLLQTTDPRQKEVVVDFYAFFR